MGKQKEKDMFNETALNELLKAKEQTESLELRLKSETDKNSSLQIELSSLKSKIAALEADLKMKDAEMNTIKISTNKDTEIKTSLEKNLEDLRKRIADLENELKSLRNSVQSKEEAIQIKDKQIIDKDEQIKALSSQVKELNDKYEGKVLGAQEQLNEAQKENEDLKLKLKDLEAKLHDLQANHDKLKERFRDSGDSALGQTMELERLGKEIEDKDARIKELEEKLGSMLTGGSGNFTTRDQIVQLFKEKLSTAHRSIRICVPNIASVEAEGFLPIIQEFPRTVVVNLAGDIKATDEHIILDLKPRGVIFTQYDQRDRWVLNRDGEDVAIAMEKEDGRIVGFYSNEPKIVSMLNSAIMEPWVRGIKI